MVRSRRYWTLCGLLLLGAGKCVFGTSQLSPNAREHEKQALSFLDIDDAVDAVPPVFLNGAWNPTAMGPLNAYVAALLSKDVYYKHVVDPRHSSRWPLARRNFTHFAAMLCTSMRRLGADECEAINGASALVWALVRAGPSVMLVARGSNSPQNWITDLVSIRTVNVGDFGGGSRGTNVAAGFYQVFAANRRDILDRVRRSMAAAAVAAQAAGAHENGADGGGGAGGRSAPRLWLFGHSLGGAVALMAAAYLDANEGLPVTGVYAFGCPRVGDDSWARAYRLDDVTMRLENTGDIVPSLPPGANWRHVGSAATIQACRELPAAPPVAAPGGGAGAGAGGDVVQYSADPEFEAAMVDRIRPVLPGADGADSHGADAAATGLRSAGAGGASRATEAATGTHSAAAAAVARRVLRGRHDTTVLDSAGVTAKAGARGLDLRVGSDAGWEKAEEAGLEQAGPFSFPFPISIRDHMVQTYVRVMWSCLPDADQGLVPGPEDVYGPYEAVY